MQRYKNDLHRALCELKTHTVIEATPLQSFKIARTLTDVDFVHCTDCTLVILAHVLKFITKANRSITACGLDVVWRPWWYQIMIKRFAPRMPKIVAISNATKDELMKRGAKAESITVIPCGIFSIDSQVFMYKNQVPVLITVGRLVKRKGVEWFIDEVLPSLLVEHPALQYYVIGDGKRKTAISKLLESKGLSSNVVLLTDLNDEERNKLIQQAHVFVMPNIKIPYDMEGFGIVCIEASIRGLQVAAARLEGIQDAVIESKTGKFFKQRNATSAIEAIHHLLRFPLDSKQVFESTKKRYEWSTLSKKYADAIFSL